MSHNRKIRLAFAILAIAFFATPIAARIAGVTAEPFENRPFATAPTLSQGWDAFGQTTNFLVDRMPLRKQAVEANTRIWTDIFGTDPNYGGNNALADDRALPFAGATKREGSAANSDLAGIFDRPVTAATGSEGWLFLDAEFEHACDSRGNRQTLLRWGKVLREIRASGRPAVMIVPPAKGSVYPEFLPDEYPNEHCALQGKDRFWRLLAQEGPENHVIELRSELVRLKEHAGDGLFQQKDSHWSTLGAFTLLRAALDAIGDGVRFDTAEIVDLGEVRYRGDLTGLTGRAERDERMEYGIERAPGAPRVPGRTLVICDSFAGEWIYLLRPYFEHISAMSISGGNDATKAIEAIRQSDRVIVESMELFWRGDDAKELAEAMLWAEPL